MAEVPKIYDEIVDFFARGATTFELLEFRPSDKAQERVRELLDRNKSGELSPEDAEELERVGVMEHFMQLVKARAHLYVDKRL